MILDGMKHPTWGMMDDDGWWLGLTEIFRHAPWTNLTSARSLHIRNSLPGQLDRLEWVGQATSGVYFFPKAAVLPWFGDLLLHFFFVEIVVLLTVFVVDYCANCEMYGLNVFLEEAFQDC